MKICDIWNLSIYDEDDVHLLRSLKYIIRSIWPDLAEELDRLDLEDAEKPLNDW